MGDNIEKVKIDEDKVSKEVVRPPDTVVTPAPIGIANVSDELGPSEGSRIKADDPLMPPPSPDTEFILPTALKLRIQEIGLAALEIWLDSIQEQAKRARHEWLITQRLDELRQKVELQQDIKLESTAVAAYIPQASASDRAASEAYLSIVQSHSGFIEGIQGLVQRARDNDASAIAAVPFLVAASSANIGSSLIGSPSIASYATSQGPSAIFAISQDFIYNTTRDDMRAELGLIGALFNTGIINYSKTQPAFGSEASGGNLKKTKQFVETYSKNLLSFIKGEDATTPQELAKFVHAMAHAKGIPPERVPIQTAKLKFALLAGAIALMYKFGTAKMIGYGSITGDEFLALISKGMAPKKTDDPIFHNLVGEMHALIKSETIPPKELEELCNCTAEYLDKNPNVEKMLGSTGLVASIL